jgi:hypothetical protein
MGNGSYDVTASTARAAFRASTGTTAFAHDQNIKTGKLKPQIHPSLNVLLKPYRECRDNDDNPISVPIAIFTDVTGSMDTTADHVLDSLNKVIVAIRDKGVISYPALLFGAIGDASSDKAPIQVGEFESDDLKAEEHLSNIYREKNGGGNGWESYLMSLWFVANKIETDHWDKRGEKGFLFIIEDENLDKILPAHHLKQFIGVDVEEDILPETIIEKLLLRWHVVIIRPNASHYYNSASVHETWTKYFGSERVIKVESFTEVVPLIAGTISVLSGLDHDTVITNINNSGLHISNSNSTALQKLSDTVAIQSVVDDLLLIAGDNTSTRL